MSNKKSKKNKEKSIVTESPLSPFFKKSDRYSHIWESDRLISKSLCFECGSDESIHFHHIIPKSQGGKMSIPLCPKCHGLVHGKNFMNHKNLILEGIRKAKERGVYKGRISDTKETTEKFLSKPKNKQVIEYLKQGMRGSDICKIIEINPNTVSKVKKVLKGIGELIK